MNARTWLVQNASVYCVDEGAGAPTLFLHGNPDSSAMWSEVITRLRARLHCFAPDLPGYGRSAYIANFDTSLENMARWVDELVTQINVAEPLNLVMHDFGAHFGLAWAIRHPERVRRMVIFNTNFFSDYVWHPLARILRTPILGELGLALFNEAQYKKQLQNDAPNVPADYIHRVMEMYGADARKMTLRLYRASDSKKFIGWEDDLLTLTQRVPTLVLWGDRDPYVSPHWAERFGAQRVEHFATASHWLALEMPQAMADQLASFLA